MLSRPFGSWDSPLNASDLAASSLRLSPPRVDGAAVYWKETGPDGRSLLRRALGGVIEDLPAHFEDGEPVDVSSRVHEYGGGDFACADDVVVFSARRDDRLYVTTRDSSGWSIPRPVTPADGVRYADLVLQGLKVYAVAEKHQPGAGAEAVKNRMVVLDIATGAVTVLREGPDFVANPRPNPAGTAIAWFEWNHPDMPWDATALCVAELDEAALEPKVLVSGDRLSSISPVWLSDEELAFVSDPNGWWNPFRCTDPLGEARIRPLHPSEIEFAAPPWSFDGSLAALDDDHVVARWTSHGHWALGSIRLSNGELEEWVTGLEPRSTPATGDGIVAFIGASQTSPPVLAELTLAAGKIRVLRESSTQLLKEEYVSLAEAIDWESDTGPVHGLFYAPTNPEFCGASSELPPVIVMVHGGPTDSADTTFSPLIQFWTTRGFAVLDVNYRGSTGYGRSYREALNGEWGVADIADLASGVVALAQRGLVDGKRAVIRGGSAGGYAVLRALTLTDAFAAGTSRYGISDLTTLAEDTHKFESRYMDRLVGPFPDAAALYRERSPIYALEELAVPVLLLQGEDDKVVPPSQARDLAAAITAAGGEAELVMYPGEGHGFRKAATITDSLDRELAFYQRVLGISTD